MTEVFYAAVKASLHASDSSVFGLRPEEYSALCRRFPDSNKQVINGILIKGSPLEVINSLAELGYRVTCTSGEAEIVWTLKREALPGEKFVSPIVSPQSTPPQVAARPFVVQPTIAKQPTRQAEKIGTKSQDWAELEKFEDVDKIYMRHVSSVEKIEPGQKVILKTNLSSEFNPLSKRPGQRGGPFIALPVSKHKPQHDQSSPVILSSPFEHSSSSSSPKRSLESTASGKMPHNVPNPSVVQSLDEMDFERGIWYPAAQGDLERVCKLLNKGVNVNSVDKSGYTALHYAVRNGDLPIVKTLLNAGADVNVKTKAGQATPLHRAAAAGHTEVVKFLLDHGASLAAVDADGRTPLHRAAVGNHEAVALLLLRSSPQSLIVRDAKGQTPLELAKGSLASIMKGHDGRKTTSPSSSKRSVSKSSRGRSVSP